MKKFNNKHECFDEIEVTSKKLLKVIGFAILGIIIAGVIGLAVKLLWNWLMPELFGLNKITYWQGAGILVLSRILFGGFGSDNNKKNDEHNVTRKVKGTVGQAIHEEIREEFYKEYEKKYSDSSQEEENEKFSNTENVNQEELYEKWWAEEGEARFEDYLRKIEKEEL